MRTVIIGGGKGCRSLLGLTTGSFLKDLYFNIAAVVDINPDAPGMALARSRGIPTYTDLSSALSLPGIELIIELTGDDSILQQLYHLLKPGMKLIDHTFTHIFWDLVNSQLEQQWQLREMERLEKDIEKEKRFLQCLFDSTADLSVVLDLDQTVTRANASFYAFIGLSPEETNGRKCYDLLEHTDIMCDFEEMDEIFKNILRDGKPVTSIRRTPPPNESHWEITHTPILDEEGEIEAVYCTWHKITENVMLKREIESAEQKFKSFINSAQDWLSIKDLEGRYIIVNPAIAKAFHLNQEDFIGKKPDGLLPKKMSQTIKNHDRLVIKTGQHQSFNEIIPIDGKDHHFQTMRFPLTDYSGQIIGVCTIARDVTKEFTLQEQLVQSEKLAALGKLAAGVAHEINNPLTGILAYAEDLIDDFPDDDPHQDDFKVILRETLRCRDIVRNLLDFARQDTPKFEIMEPKRIVDSALSLIVRLPQFKDIIIEQKTDDEMPHVRSDPHQMQQVLLNLMLNAADAMKFKGKITISTEYDRKNDKCIISVEDTGPGIPENLIDKIFEPFFSTKGTNGLGLAVSWGIVERHVGTIEIDTATSGGAIFRIVLSAHK